MIDVVKYYEVDESLWLELQKSANVSKDLAILGEEVTIGRRLDEGKFTVTIFNPTVMGNIFENRYGNMTNYVITRLFIAAEARFFDNPQVFRNGDPVFELYEDIKLFDSYPFFYFTEDAKPIGECINDIMIPLVRPSRMNLIEEEIYLNSSAEYMDDDQKEKEINLSKIDRLIESYDYGMASYVFYYSQEDRSNSGLYYRRTLKDGEIAELEGKLVYDKLRGENQGPLAYMAREIERQRIDVGHDD